MAAALQWADDVAGLARQGTFTGPDCSRLFKFEALILVHVGGSDIVCASLLADQVSVLFRKSQADYTLLATWTQRLGCTPVWVVQS